LRFIRTSLIDIFNHLRKIQAFVPEHERSRLKEEHELEYIEEELPLAIEQSLDGVEHVARIVKAMKFMSHNERSADMTSINVNAALDYVATVATPETRYVADVCLELGNIPNVMGFPTDLNQVFLNLIVNAAHAVGDRVNATGHRGTIRIRTWLESDEVVVSIEDSGTGIPEHIRNRVFDPFFTTKEVGRGTGQGLSIVRSVIVGKHGGSLDFKTELEVGTTFFVRLPVSNARHKSAA
jgi:signal transduction histidine kinase